MTPGGTDWQSAMRHRILAARAALVRHPWASGVIESRTDMSPTMITYFDEIIGMFREGGFSMDLIHHGLHALGSRVLGFSQELFDEGDDLAENPEMAAILMQQMADHYPNLTAMIAEMNAHEEGSPQVGPGCDDQVEFEFGIDLLLDGLERLRIAEG